MKLIRFALPDTIERWLLATVPKKRNESKENDDNTVANEKQRRFSIFTIRIARNKQN